MKSQLSRSDIIVSRIATLSFFTLFLAAFVVSWFLQGKPELLVRWLEASRYLGVACLGLQLTAFAFVIRRSGIAPTILFLIGGFSFLGFIFLLSGWLLQLGVAASGAGFFWLALPQIRHLFHRMRQSYLEIKAVDKS